MKMPIKLDYEDVIKRMVEQDWEESVAWLEMGELFDGRKLCLVFGWTDEYEAGEKYQKKVGKKIYTLTSKLAVNIDDLQCDYDIDWYMPYGKNGDVYDTEMAVADDQWLYYKKEAQHIIRLMNTGVLEA